MSYSTMIPSVGGIIKLACQRLPNDRAALGMLRVDIRPSSLPMITTVPLCLVARPFNRQNTLRCLVG